MNSSRRTGTNIMAWIQVLLYMHLAYFRTRRWMIFGRKTCFFIWMVNLVGPMNSLPSGEIQLIATTSTYTPMILSLMDHIILLYRMDNREAHLRWYYWIITFIPCESYIVHTPVNYCWRNVGRDDEAPSSSDGTSAVIVTQAPSTFSYTSEVQPSMLSPPPTIAS